MSLNLQLDSKAAHQFQLVLTEYIAWNKRDIGPLLDARATRIRWEIYKRFRDLAPTKDELETDLKARGYRVKRRRRRGAGTKKRFVKIRNKKIREQFQKRRPSPTRLELEEEIALRQASIKFLSVGFLFREWKRAKDGQSGDFKATGKKFQGGRSRTIGKADVNTSAGLADPRVIITSYLEGVVKQNQQRGIVDQVLAGEVADMQVYIRRKQEQAFRQTMRRG
ncbi:MAG: hypothetical protein Q7P63_01135 [Verrucomicrobiota bacterium JB022]|nr:hypothetical protein [Verrucomicrobiota bacterium JB022]